MQITFKTKVRTMYNPDNTVAGNYVDFKKQLSRKDVDCNASTHDWYNSDMFPSMLNRAYKAVIGEYKTWSYVNDLPANVSIDTSKFLAVISIQLPDNFR